MEKENLGEKINIAVGEIKKIRMTDEEKRLSFQKILSSLPAEGTPVPSPFAMLARKSRKSRTLVLSAFVCFLVLSAGGMAFASKGSLPGTFLYPLKVKIVEPIRTTLKFSSESKLEYESELATKRIVEAKILATQDKLDSQKEEKLDSLLKEHVKAFEKTAVKLEDADKFPGKKSEIVEDFKVKMETNAKALEEMAIESKDKPGKAGAGERISKTARESAAKTVEILGKNKK